MTWHDAKTLRRTLDLVFSDGDRDGSFGEDQFIDPNGTVDDWSGRCGGCCGRSTWQSALVDLFVGMLAESIAMLYDSFKSVQIVVA
ncbi:MAG: hypothetical protein P4L46_07505 [Fimbriimonas sp.]|nr:hypothetical protein [Fimbriimonas sp.]